MFSTTSLTENASCAASGAIRSLNADFVRKGIVVSAGADDTSTTKTHGLDPKIRSLVDSLRGTCKAAGSKELGAIASAVQLWKERSLHHTLLTLDQARSQASVEMLKLANEHQIQAIELHDKAGREIKDTAMRVVQAIVDAIVKHIDGFTAELTVANRGFFRPELEEELLRERVVTERLILEKQNLMEDRIELQEANTQLTQRIETWETAADGGGDAILCRKLREQVKHLRQQQIDRELSMTQIQQDHEQWRYEMVQMKTEVDRLHKTLALTRAMHEKEIKQLVELVHVKASQLEQVRQATVTATRSSSSLGNSCIPAKVSSTTAYDPHSGRSICYVSPSEVTATQPSSTRPVFACLPPQKSSPTASPPRPMTRAAASPNKKRIVTSAPAHASIESPKQRNDLAVEPSPHGRVRRPFPGTKSLSDSE